MLPSPISRVNSSASQQPNPLSIRLYKVLAANFDDDATKAAVQTLAELYGPPGHGASKAKGKQVQRDSGGDHEELDEEDGDDKANGTVGTTRDGDKTAVSSVIETIPGEIAAKARRGLRRDVENKLAESSRRFLAAFSEVDKQLDTLQEHVGAMRTRCDEAQSQLRETNDSCRSLLDRAGSLREQRQEVSTRQSIVTAFLERFTLTSEEIEAIVSREVPVNKRFFKAMDKAERIRDDCRVLMAGEDGPTKAGVDIITKTSGYLEQAYEKIFRWCSFEFRQMGRDSSVDVHPSLREAVRRLRQRSELLTEALTTLGQTRQSTLLSSFTTALTRGGPSGLPRPIELHAHDPLRYIGDMLAWVHQAIAAEREFLEGLFGVRAEEDGRMVGAVRQFTQSEEEEWMSELMDVAVGGLCTPLKTRVQQTIRSQESSITSYKITNLLQFYMLTMQRTIGEKAALSRVLQDTTDFAYSVFYEAIGVQGRSLSAVTLDTDDTSLTPPLVILDHAQVLREILLVYESSLGDDIAFYNKNRTTERNQEQDARRREAAAEGCHSILDKMVDPAVEMCIVASETKQRLVPNWDREVFVVNVMTYLQSVLEPFAFTAEKQGFIQSLVEGRMMQLIEDHYTNVIADTGLGEIVEAWKSRKANEPLSHLPAASGTRLQAALHSFSLWLTGNTIDHPPRLAQLLVQSLATRVHRAALARLVHTYRWICDEVRKPENKYEAASTLLGSERPFGQVHLLWQIFGIDEESQESKEQEKLTF
ncbi:oligomeric complex COG6 [Irpex rosettiformis]|uniref:Oligomeric complex COG6 n=1 Tax=Irpex rosettiformis TaxID=378272 RepID=A0ACB8UIQ5_9APHY|nr:oligomeric complex COG6 [Irpex rosettiformis]